METIFEIDPTRRTPKYQQIINSVTKSIKSGKLKKGDKILSINELSNECLLSRDTVQKAYTLLEEDGIITAIPGKGFYINRTDITIPYRILLLFNKISNYKKQIYNSFVEVMGNKAAVDLKIFHCDSIIFENYINTYLNEYDYYVIMPHFYENIETAYKAILKIPEDKLLILDKNMPGLQTNVGAVYQDFQNDIAEALEGGMHLLQKYNKLILVYPETIPYPYEIVTGFKNFCMEYHFAYSITHECHTGTVPHAKEAWIVIEETDLVNLIKKCMSGNLKIGKDIGIISYNETPLKEILLDGITVISTDHAKMGETAARLILENSKQKIKNPFSLIQRKSL